MLQRPWRPNPLPVSRSDTGSVVGGGAVPEALLVSRSDTGGVEGAAASAAEAPADPDAPSGFTSPSTSWSCIQKYFRRGGLVYIQMLGRVNHGYTLNEHDELSHWRNGPGDEIAFTPPV